MSVKLRKRQVKDGKVIYLDCYFKGKRWAEFPGLKLTGRPGHDKNVMSIAEQMRARRELEIAASAKGLIPDHKKAISVGDYLDRYAETYTRANKRMIKSVRNHATAFFDGKLLSEITEREADNFRHYLGKHFNGETPYDYFRIFRRILYAAVREGVIASNPAQFVKNDNPVAGQLRKQALTTDEINRLYGVKCQNESVKRAFIFACNTGLRLVDVRRCRWSDIDIDRRELSIIQSKTGKIIRLPLNTAALGALGQRGRPMERPFILPSSTAVNKALKSWVKSAGIEKHITFHSARHSFVSNVLRATGNLKLAGILAGHSSSAHTEKYAHVLDEDRRRAVDSL